jgi:hypothetical protein
MCGKEVRGEEVAEGGSKSPSGNDPHNCQRGGCSMKVTNRNQNEDKMSG